MTDQHDVIGVIGLGQMGGAMRRTLVRGWRVVAWDMSPAALDAAITSGVMAASDPADVADRAEIIITSLPDGEAVRAVISGDRGLIQDGRGSRLVIDTSTLLPAEARSIETELSTHGVAFLDAPVSGGVKGADNGSLAIMVGGDGAGLRTSPASPRLPGQDRRPLRRGRRRSDHQVVQSTRGDGDARIIAEALALAQSSGLDPWRVREVLLGGYGASPILEIQGPRMLRRDFAPGGRARFHLKDIVAIAGLAGEAGLELPVFEAAARQFERLVDAGGGDLDNSAVITVLDAHRRVPQHED